LAQNQLSSLPESFGLIRVGGSVHLMDNNLLLKDIPDKFPNVSGSVLR